MFQQSKEVSHSYIPTPGIDMGSYEVDGVGRLSIWDAAGHIEYHMTHGMFLGSRYSIAAVVYDLQEEEAIKVNISLESCGRKECRNQVSVHYETYSNLPL